ncbi:hypothetical protein SARC_01977 [Sphaeroforma arctica JP610]|uniref:Uncharacterized protein n=1 Tax=Sphaeroforma arctica JP610 TaxID=667725 RepID=A0A0L0GC75_9EUKA|nr:hypothetical protein SARC_01977 [Sphaeroforma arctica JP610]KNC85868.1 hypothetical protein SARC_01977 [Sphaeroforma arctica JP610]|eukprot:XP_014159770.1 hypothetical protein SARC_01977 [Sphaeroforma arctica JP610]
MSGFYTNNFDTWTVSTNERASVCPIAATAYGFLGDVEDGSANAAETGENLLFVNANVNIYLFHSMHDGQATAAPAQTVISQSFNPITGKATSTKNARAQKSRAKRRTNR